MTTAQWCAKSAKAIVKDAERLHGVTVDASFANDLLTRRVERMCRVLGCDEDRVIAFLDAEGLEQIVESLVRSAGSGLGMRHARRG